jgi:hypothetical protein
MMHIRFSFQRFFLWSCLLGGCWLPSLAQKTGTVNDENVEVIKPRKAEIPAPTRVFEKISSNPNNEVTKEKVVYEFVERRLPVQTPDFSPPVTDLPYTGATTRLRENPLDNIVEIGLGNFLHKYFDVHLSSQTDRDLVVGGTLKHNSLGIGPVDAGNSGTNENRAKIWAKYVGERFKLSSFLAYDREMVKYYGYRPGIILFDADTIAVVNNKVSLGLGVDNPNPRAKVDWGITSRVSYFFRTSKENEILWESKARLVFPITDNFTAMVNADIALVNTSDSLSTSRRLYRVAPTFSYQVDQGFTITAGLRALSSRDERSLISPANLYPLVKIGYNLPNFSLFAGFEGDVTLNSLTSFIAENPWLGKRAVLANTEKNADFYGGIKGNLLESAIHFEAQASYATYRNFYTFNNTRTDSTRFAVQYDTARSTVVTLSGALSYQMADIWRSSLKTSYYIYNMGSFEQAWQRPTLTGSWTNTVIFKEKLIIDADFYWLAGIKAQNLFNNRVVSLPAIVDLNFKFTYLFTEKLAGFVSVNNLLNRNYQKFLNYPTVGLNTLVGLTYSF